MGEFKIGLNIGGIEMVTRGLSISSSELEDEEEVESFLSKLMLKVPLSLYEDDEDDDESFLCLCGFEC